MNLLRVKISFIILGTVFLIFALCNIGSSKTSRSMRTYFKEKHIKKNYIYFDLGSNNGDSILSFFELEPRLPKIRREKFHI